MLVEGLRHGVDIGDIRKIVEDEYGTIDGVES